MHTDTARYNMPPDNNINKSWFIGHRHKFISFLSIQTIYWCQRTSTQLLWHLYTEGTRINMQFWSANNNAFCI